MTIIKLYTGTAARRSGTKTESEMKSYREVKGRGKYGR